MRDVKRREGEGREGGEDVIEDYAKNIRTYELKFDDSMNNRVSVLTCSL